MTTVASLQIFGSYPVIISALYSWLNRLGMALYAGCMQLKPIPPGPGAFEDAEVLIAFAISSLLAMFHESGLGLRASASVKCISRDGGFL